RLISCLWGEDPPASVEAQLHQQVARLRRVMGRDAGVCGPSGYLLRTEPMTVDVEMFDAAAAAGQAAMGRGSAEEAARDLRRASRWAQRHPLGRSGGYAAGTPGAASPGATRRPAGCWSLAATAAGSDAPRGSRFRWQGGGVRRHRNGAVRGEDDLWRRADRG